METKTSYFALTNNILLIFHVFLIIFWVFLDKISSNPLISLNGILIASIVFLISLVLNVLRISTIVEIKEKSQANHVWFLKVKIFLSAFILTSSFTSAIIIILDLVTLKNVFAILVILLALILILVVVFDINSITKQPIRPNAYILKEFIKPIERYSNDYTSTFTIKLILLSLLLGIPIISGLLSGVNEVASLVVWIGVYISLLVGGYWLGYGLYKSYRWIWGYENIFNPNSSLEQSLNRSDKLNLIFSRNFLPINIAILVTISLVFLVLTLGLKIIFKGITIPSYTLVYFFIIFFMLILLSTPKITTKQPWYSFHYINFLFIIPSFWVLALKVLNSTNGISNIDLLKLKIFQSDFLLILVIIGVIFLFLSNNKHLRFILWNDNYESTNFLSEIDPTSPNSSIFHLNVIQKFGDIQGDKELTLSLLSIYDDFIESHKKDRNKSFQTSFSNLLIFQLQHAMDWDVHQKVFELTHTYIDLFPDDSKIVYYPCIYNLRHLDPRVKYEAINLLGHLLQFNQETEFIAKIYDHLEISYKNSEEKHKKLIINAFTYYIQSFELYRERIFLFLTEQIQKELAGVCISIFALFEELVVIEPTFVPKIYKICQKELESTYSQAKLGTIYFLKNCYPKKEEEQELFYKLLEMNLRDTGNPTGIRPNIVYALGDIILEYTTLANKIKTLTEFIKDSDSDVRSAIVQIFSKFYSYDLLSLEKLTSILEEGIKDRDYIVRMIVFKSILSLLKEIDENKVYSTFSSFISLYQKGIADESIHVHESVTELFQYIASYSNEARSRLKKDERFKGMFEH